jgi:uncharacterized RDD family membrane protein YckC
MALTRAAEQPAARPRRTGRVRYASFEARVAAGLIDAVVFFIIGALLIAVGSLIVLISSDFERVEPSEFAVNLFWACAASIVPVALLFLFVSLAWKGQTVGKSVMQIMVIRSDGRPLGILGSMGRVIGLLVYPLFLGAGALGGYALRETMWQAVLSIGVAVTLVSAGLLWAAFDPHRRTLHDRIAGTIVVRVG